MEENSKLYKHHCNLLCKKQADSFESACKCTLFQEISDAADQSVHHQRGNQTGNQGAQKDCSGGPAAVDSSQVGQDGAEPAAHPGEGNAQHQKNPPVTVAGKSPAAALPGFLHRWTAQRFIM